MPCTEAAPAGEHLPLTVLGRAPKPARYVLDARESEARLAPLALLDLLPEEDRPNRVLALCTPEAEQDSLPLLEGALGVRLAGDFVGFQRFSPCVKTEENAHRQGEGRGRSNRALTR